MGQKPDTNGDIQHDHDGNLAFNIVQTYITNIYITKSTIKAQKKQNKKTVIRLNLDEGLSKDVNRKIHPCHVS